jgi:hypothetical protein
MPILIIVTIFSINTGALIFAADFCDRAAQDCARAAGKMSTPDDAVNAMNATSLAHPVDGYFFRQLTPELLVYQDYNQSMVRPTPKYGSTSAYAGENGVNNITPAISTEELAKLNAVDNPKGAPINEPDISAAIQKDIASTAKIDAILADPNQTVTAGPYVVVRTTMLMRIPIGLNILGAKIFVGNVDGNPQFFKFSSVYTFPITNTYVPL